MDAPAPGGNSLLNRVIVAIIFIPLIVWLFWTGGYPFFIFLAVITAFGQWELFRMFEQHLRFPHRVVGFTAGMLIILSAFFGYMVYITGIIVISLVCSCIIEIVSGEVHRLETIVLSLFATVYPSCFNVFLVRLSGYRYDEHFSFGRYVLLYVLLVIWIFDTASYFFGKKFGKHPFFPSVSPKKTLEGFFGGVFCVVILGIAAAIFAGKPYFYHVFVLTILTALAGQAGDLAANRGTRVRR